MGHTARSQRIVADIIIKELSDYGKALRAEDRHIYEELLASTFKRVGAISYTSSVNAWAFVLISIILEQEKRIRQHEKKEGDRRLNNHWKSGADERVSDGRLQERELDCPVDKGGR